MRRTRSRSRFAMRKAWNIQKEQESRGKKGRKYRRFRGKDGGRDKKAKEMMAGLRVGDNIKTIGGVYGKIVALKDDLVTIESGPDKCKIVFAKGAIASVESADVDLDDSLPDVK